MNNESKVNIWNNKIPVEKSSYLAKDIKYINYEKLEVPKNKYVMLDLFCGAGGFSVGSGMAGFQSVLGIDNLRPAIETWSYNHPNALACFGDIRKIPPEDIKRMLLEKGINKIHLITGGIPCQGFSLANRKRNYSDERNFLFVEYMKYVKVFEPDYIILENVLGMRNADNGSFEESIRKTMEELGYTTTVELINSADYGVPQTRHRLFFVGVKNGAGFVEKYQFPEGEFFDPMELTLSESNKKPYRTVYDAISDLPKLGNNETKDKYDCEPITEYQKIMRGESEDFNIEKPIQLSNHTSPNHPEETIKKIAETKPGESMYERFRQRIRLSYDKPSPTQLAGGIRPQFQFGHPTQPRGLSIRERARIQSFPDSYVFKGGIVQERVQTGNAVPPLMIYAVTKVIAEDLDGKYK